MCIFAKDGSLYANGTNQKYDFTLKTWDRVTVRRNGNIIEWLRGDKALCAAPITKKLRKTALFPVFWIKSYLFSEPSVLRFVW
jgi:hypothetical protein